MPCIDCTVFVFAENDELAFVADWIYSNKQTLYAILSSHTLKCSNKTIPNLLPMPLCLIQLCQTYSRLPPFLTEIAYYGGLTNI